MFSAFRRQFIGNIGDVFFKTKSHHQDLPLAPKTSGCFYISLQISVQNNKIFPSFCISNTRKHDEVNKITCITQKTVSQLLFNITADLRSQHGQVICEIFYIS